MNQPNPERKQINVDFTASKGLTEFLTEIKSSLVISTYQTGNLFLIGAKNKDTISINPITLKRPMGLFNSGQSLYVADRYQIFRFNNVVPLGQSYQDQDRIYIPQVSWTTADMDVHDIALDKAGRLLFVNTLFSCIASVSEENSFKKIWQPPFISNLAPEDRCHLNGLALRDGELRYASAFSSTDTKEGWRKNKDEQGVIWDIKNNKAVVTGITMPHSPRWYADKLWFIESGSGAVIYYDEQTKQTKQFVTLPGYLRGLNFHGNYLVVASSILRDNSGIKDKKLEDALTKRGEKQTCGVFILNISTGELLHFIKISEDVQELYDVIFLPNTTTPKAFNLDSEEVRFILSIG
jgi:uncharacterized protein (TIGR03032 family)